jgi:hypothetical protein
MNFRSDWSWLPDANTIRRIADGNRKCRRFELPPNRIEEMKMESANPVNGSAVNNEVAAAKFAGKPAKAVKKAVRKVVKKVVAKKAAKVVDANLIPLKTLCKDLDIDPRLARRKLRKAKISGHSERNRWSFKKGSPQLDKARECLKA